MRNLKKVLSLALALVMLLGMMVVGAGAATSFTDDDEIQNKEAVAVLVGMGIMKGRTNGADDDVLFAPEATLTRAEAAKMIAQMDLGVQAADALKANGTNTFSDVWADYWAAGPIDYCVEQGYINGDGNGHFFPGQNVTGVQFASMLLRLLGYDAKIEGLVGDKWAVNAAALARKAGLTTKVLANSEYMTRDGMAQMAFNALTAPTVEYEGMDITIGDVAINARVKTRVHTGSVPDANTTYDGEEIKSNITPIRLCEERFPDLKLVRDSLDNFGREFNVWTWKRVNIAGSESKVTPDAEFTAATKATTVKSAINGATGTTNDGTYNRDIVELYINGRPVRNGVLVDSNLIAGLTANGRQVQVYLFDNDHKAIKKVVVVDTYVAKVNSVSKDGTDDRYVTVVPQDYSDNGPQTPIVKADNKAGTESLNLIRTKKTADFAAGDVVSYTAAWNGSTTSPKYNIQDMTALEIAATATLEKWVGTGVTYSNKETNKGESDTNFTAGGQKYNYSVNNAIVDDGGNVLTLDNSKRIAEFAAGKSEINIYLDQYDYAIYVSGVEAPKNYAAVIGAGQSNQYGSETRGVTLLMPDGTTKEVTAKMDIDEWKQMSALDANDDLVTDLYNPDNRNLVSDFVADVVTYSESGGVYSLTLVDKDSTNPTGSLDATSQGTTGLFFKNGKSAMTINTKAGTKSCYTTDKTIFMVATEKVKGNPSRGYDYASYIGYNAAPNIENAKVTGVAYALNKYHPNQIDAVYIAASEVEGIQNYTYFVKEKTPAVTTIAGHVTYTLPAVVDGEVTEIAINAEIKDNWYGASRLDKAGVGLYVIKNIKVEDDIIVDCDVVALTDAFRFTDGVKPGTIRANDGVLGFGDKDEVTGTGSYKAAYCAYNNNTKVFRVDEDWTSIEAITVSAVPTDLNDEAFADSINSGDDRRLTTVFVHEVDGNFRPSNPQTGALKVSDKSTAKPDDYTITDNKDDTYTVEAKSGKLISVTSVDNCTVETVTANTKFTVKVTDTTKDATIKVDTKVAGNILTDDSYAGTGKDLTKNKSVTSAVPAVRDGKVQLDFEIDVPKYVATGATAKISATVLADGYVVGTITDSPVSASNLANGKHRVTVTADEINADSVITLEDVEIVYSDIVVRYIKKGTETSATPTLIDKLAAIATANSKLSTATEQDLKVAYDATKWTDGGSENSATFTVNGTKPLNGTPTMGGTITNNNGSIGAASDWNTGTKTYVAVGNDYVDIIIDGLSVKPETFGITSETANLTTSTGVAIETFGQGKLGTNANKAAVLEIAAKTGTLTGHKKGESIQLTAAITGTNTSDWETDAALYGFRVTVKVGTKTLSAVITDGDGTEADLKANYADAAAAYITLNENYEIKDTDVTVEYITNIAIAEKSAGVLDVEHTVGTQTYKIKLNKAVASVNADGKVIAGTDVTTDDAATGQGVVSAEITDDGMSITVTLAKELASTKKITLVQDKFKDAVADCAANTNAADLDAILTVTSGDESWAAS